MTHCMKIWNGGKTAWNVYRSIQAPLTKTHNNFCTPTTNLHISCLKPAQSHRKYSTAENVAQDAKTQNREISALELEHLLEQPLKHEDFFGVKDLVTVEDLFKARVHYGHKLGSRNENMKEYLFGCRLDVDIFDLDKTIVHMHTALNFLAHMAFREAIILFITKNPIYAHKVETMAKECGQYAQTRFWHNGCFTNTESVFNTFTWKLRLPDVCVFLSLDDRVNSQHEAINEAAKMGISTVGVVDSNVNPTLITYPIPGNDDSIPSAELYCR
uniref:28S ribosomal protein S2, mitochondrial-like n=1 Tax=Phallusia mammillata TaxID=59560 RepID=A0A6F9DLI6_9ASCI|nr:28S ribosomal protein S2, mitochondrial-like [Phallusia mammillata]